MWRDIDLKVAKMLTSQPAFFLQSRAIGQVLEASVTAISLACSTFQIHVSARNNARGADRFPGGSSRTG